MNRRMITEACERLKHKERIPIVTEVPKIIAPPMLIVRSQPQRERFRRSFSAHWMHMLILRVQDPRSPHQRVQRPSPRRQSSSALFPRRSQATRSP